MAETQTKGQYGTGGHEIRRPLPTRVNGRGVFLYPGQTVSCEYHTASGTAAVAGLHIQGPAVNMVGVLGFHINGV